MSARQSLVEADLQNTIGWAYGAIGEYGKAEAILRESLALRRKFLGNESREVAYSLDTLGCVLYTEWKLTEAEATLREALAIRKKLYAPPREYVVLSPNEDSFHSAQKQILIKRYYKKSYEK